MGIDAIKRWQWLLIGLIIGFGLGWTQSDPEDDRTVADGRLISQRDFEREILAKHPKTAEPLIKGIVIQPITTDYRGEKVQPVKFDRLQQGAKTGKTIYVPAQYIAAVPYKAENSWATKPTIAEYLDDVAKRNKDFHYRYGWYNERRTSLVLWTLGGAAVVGGIWPTILGLFTGVSIGSSRERKVKEDYFSRFSHAPDPAMAGKVKVVSDAERQRLDDMNAVLERDLKGAIKDADTVNIPADQKAPADVRKLEGGPLETAPIAKPADEDDEVEIKGEYYPVMIHHKKHHGEDSDAPKPDTKK